MNAIKEEGSVVSNSTEGGPAIGPETSVSQTTRDEVEDGTLVTGFPDAEPSKQQAEPELSRPSTTASTGGKSKEDKKEKEFDPTGRPEDGRPKNSRDKEKRKQKEPKPRTSVNSSEFVVMSLWASEAQSKISGIINPAILSHYDKASLRSLTKSETEQLEHLKLCILCNMEPFIDVSPEIISELLKRPILVESSTAKLLATLREGFLNKNEREPSIDEVRQMNVSGYALSKTG